MTESHLLPGHVWGPEHTKIDVTHSVSRIDMYEYGGLTKATNIRLLHLNPGSINPNHLHGTMYEYSQADAPQYECLSYVWGTGDKAASIRIGKDARIIAITESLHRVLLSLRHVSKERVLWVD
ncbi:hypothetical protein BU25DRAFT_406995 [Macroventuria anomochaeta]|uniref:Uncharacterized protein n=1 Tax=Macroventuria anomochaeta TaxID=301207 RepID=A0ACB6SGK1_9PLEO|nr:uncharacterized protein BU25DRAFT_406995 [Macroventuria anomochaeta]KAF2632468.1 hypothetical protein BU25DRAFT_406995 [Macroventuria anomochaeta]